MEFTQIEGARIGLSSAPMTLLRPKWLVALGLLMIPGMGAPIWAQSPHPQSKTEIPTVFHTVVVTASRTEELQREVSNNLTVLDEEAISASGAQTVRDLLVEQGFNSVSFNDVSGVQIRGFGSLTGGSEHTNTVLFLLNGRRTGNSNLTLTGLSNVERVEISRGPSVQYGSSAMGGVINIITKRGGDKWVGSMELGVGSDATKRQKLAISGGQGKFDFSLGATNNERGDITTSGGRRWYHTSIDHNIDTNAELGYTFAGNHRVGSSFHFADINSTLSSSGIRSNTSASGFSNYQKDTDNLAFSYSGNTLANRFTWSADYSLGNYDQWSDGSFGVFRTFVDSKFFNVQSTYNHSGLLSVSYGLDSYKYADDPQTFSMKDVGFHTTAKVRPFEDRLILTGGMRFDRHTNQNTLLTTRKNNTTGSLGLAYLPQSWLKLRGNYALGFKMPSPTQVSGNGTSTISNPSLKPEESETFELGADVAWKYVDVGMTWFTSDWQNKIVSVIVPGPCSSATCRQNQNVVAQALDGVETSASTDVAAAFGRSFSLAPYVTMTWLTHRENQDASQFITFNGSTNNTIPNTPEWMVSYGVRYKEPILKIKSQLTAAYYGETFTQDFNTTGSPWIRRLAGTVVNLTFEKELGAIGGKDNTLTLRAEVNNILDGVNELYYDYPGPGRGFYLGLRFDRR